MIISYLATFLGTNSLSVLMCRKAVNQSINLIKIKLLNKVFKVSCCGFLTKNNPVYFGGAVEL